MERLHATYREVNRYPDLAPHGIAGSLARTPLDEIRTRAHAVVRDLLEEPRRRDLVRLHENPVPERASIDLETILSDAAKGRVDVLFLAPDDATRERANRAAVETLRHRGTVHVVEAARLPASAHAAALMRY